MVFHAAETAFQYLSSLEFKAGSFYVFNCRLVSSLLLRSTLGELVMWILYILILSVILNSGALNV